ncbi:hypothetical protein V6N13_025813 [Hibiscus sabdariffa]
MKDKHAVPVQQKGHICFHEESSSSNSYSGFSSLGDDHVFEGAGAGVDVPSGPASFTAAMPLRSIPVPASVTSPLGVATATSLNAEEGVVVPTEATVGVAGTNDVFAVDVSSKAAAPVVAAPAFDAIEEWLAEDNDFDAPITADLPVKIPAKRSLGGLDPSKAKRGRIQTTWVSTSGTVLDKFSAIGKSLKSWQERRRAKSVGRIRFLQCLIDKSLQLHLSRIPNCRLVNAKLELERLLRANEIYWVQRSRVQCTASVLNIAVAYFSGLFTSSSSFENPEILNHIL